MPYSGVLNCSIVIKDYIYNMLVLLWNDRRFLFGLAIIRPPAITATRKESANVVYVMKSRSLPVRKYEGVKYTILQSNSPEIGSQ